MGISFVPTRLNDLVVDVSLTSVARGDLLYRGASKWNNLAAGTSGYVLTSNGAGSDPSWQAASGGSGAPIDDATAIVKGSGDATKLLRFEVDGFTTATTRVITPPDANITLAGQNYANTFSLAQTIAQTAATGSPAPALLITGAAHTALTASTENIGINLNQSATKQFAAGALTTQREVVIQAPTYSFVSGSNTITTAATVAITGAPIAGTNCAAITNEYGLQVDGTTLITPTSTSTFALILREYSGHSGGYGSLIGQNSAGITYWSFQQDGLGFGGIFRPRISSSGWVGYSGIHFSLAADNIIKWSNGSDGGGTFDLEIARSAAGILEINNATAGQWAQLKLGTYDSGTTTVTDGLTVGHRSSGTPAAGLGSAILFNIDSSTTSDQAAGRLSFSWATATHASRLSKAAISVYDVSTSRDAIVCEAVSGGVQNTLYGTQIVRQVGGTPGTDEVQISHSGTAGLIECKDGNVTLDFPAGSRAYIGVDTYISRGGGGAGGIGTITTARSVVDAGGVNIKSIMFADVPVLLLSSDTLFSFYSGTNIGGGSSGDSGFSRSAAGVVKVTNGSTGYGSLVLGTTDSGTTTITDSLTIGRDSTGTPAAGLGSAILFNIDSSTTADQNAARLQASWNVATHASRTSEVGVKVVTNAGSLAEVARFDGGGGASPSAGNTGFMLWDVDNNTLERVTVGAADSGGTGYKVLRIPN